MNIQHVRQEDYGGCVVACCAMLAGVSYQEAATLWTRTLAKRRDVTDFKRVGLNNPEELELLSLLGVETAPHEEFEYDHFYSVTVPSINIPKANHRIVLDTRPPHFEQWLVFDPQLGNVPKTYGPTWDLVGYADLLAVPQ